MNWLMARHSIRRPESDLDMLRVTMPTVSTNFSSGRGWLDNGRNTNTQIQNKVNKAVTDVFYNMTDCFIMENRTDLGKCMYSPVRTHTHTHTHTHIHTHTNTHTHTHTHTHTYKHTHTQTRAHTHTHTH